MLQVTLYLATLVPFLLVDLMGLRLILRPLFETHVGAILRPDPLIGVAAAFYCVYVAGIVWFAGWPAFKAGLLWPAALHGAILGLIAYGTYEATNMATLRGWSWTMVLVDVLWGTALTAMAAVAGVAIVRALGLGPG